MKKLNYLLKSIVFILLLFLSSCLPPSDHTYTCKGCECEDSQTANFPEKLVGPDKTFNGFSIYDITGKLDADGACHADFTLEYCWKDENRAKTDPTEPPLYVEFRTVLGYFPQREYNKESYIDDLGMHRWKITYSGAADKNVHEATNYSIDIFYQGDENADPVKNQIACFATIEYIQYETNDVCTCED